MLLLSSVSVIGQNRIYFCSDYTQTGDPIGETVVWDTKPAGGSIYILYQNNGLNFNTNVLLIMIEKLDTNKVYKGYTTKSIFPDRKKNWAAYNFKFTEAGEYKVRFIDAKNNELAAGFVTIKIADLKNKKLTDKVVIGYYDGTILTFCEGIDEQNISPIAPSAVFNISTNGGCIYVILECPKILNTDAVFVDIYEGTYYDNLVETKNFRVNPNKLKTFFKYTFSKPGNYKLDIYNNNSIKIHTGTLTIN